MYKTGAIRSLFRFFERNIKKPPPRHSVAHGIRNTSTTLTSPDSGRLLFGG